MLLGIVLSGCSSEGAIGIPLDVYPVRGRVTVNGHAAAAARVIFHPHDEDVTVTPYGVVDSDGTFELTTFRANDGAPAGEYTVTISWAPPKSSGSDPDEGPEQLPAMFQDPESSGLNATIEPDSNELEPFDLKI